MAEKKVIIRLDNSDEVENSVLEYLASIPRHRRQERLRRILFLGIGVETKSLSGVRGKGRPTTSKAPKKPSGKPSPARIAQEVKESISKKPTPENVSNDIDENIVVPTDKKDSFDVPDRKVSVSDIVQPETVTRSFEDDAVHEQEDEIKETLQKNDDAVQSVVVNPSEDLDESDDLSDLKGMF